MRIMLDAGHGKNTAGKRTIDESMKEFEFNSVVADLVKKELESYSNVETRFSHSFDRDVPLSERTQLANEWKADLFLSIHANAFGVYWNEVAGIETYIHTSKPEKAYQLAAVIHNQLLRHTGRKNRGLREANFHVLRESNMTAVLLECGFMTNAEEAKLLKTDSYRKTCATAIVQGLVEFYKLSKSTPFYKVQVGSFESLDNAKALQQHLLTAGFKDTFIVQ